MSHFTQSFRPIQFLESRLLLKTPFKVIFNCVQIVAIIISFMEAANTGHHQLVVSFADHLQTKIIHNVFIIRSLVINI